MDSLVVGSASSCIDVSVGGSITKKNYPKDHREISFETQCVNEWISRLFICYYVHIIILKKSQTFVHMETRAFT